MQEVHKKPVSRLSGHKMPRMTKFVLRALVVSGSELPDEKCVGLCGTSPVTRDREAQL